VENEVFSRGGGNDFVGAGLLGGMLRAEIYSEKCGPRSSHWADPRVTSDFGRWRRCTRLANTTTIR
jgi:hypothetical protein